MSYEISPEDARHVLWAVGDPRGYRPGSFTETLLDALGRSDPQNEARLMGAFPGLVSAVQIVRLGGGREELARIAEAGAPVASAQNYVPRLAFVVAGEPIPKGRPRSKPGQQAYTPPKTREAEKKVRLAFQSMHPAFVPLTGRLEFHAEFYRATHRYVDCDNLLKLCTDALNRVAFVDDEQIEELSGRRVYGVGTQARTVIRIAEAVQELPELFGDSEKE